MIPVTEVAPTFSTASVLPPVRLEIRNLCAGYGATQVVRGVSVSVRAGEVVAMLGRNGSGRSTLCQAITGLLEQRRGSVQLDGKELIACAAHEVALAGIAYVPEQRMIFDHLTVEENLLLGKKPRNVPHALHVSQWSMEEMYHFYPRLYERRSVRAGLLSGGEQQLLALFRSLIGNPLAIVIDEPSEGLAPQLLEVLVDVIAEMKRRGLAVLLMEQKQALALRSADRVLILGRGALVFDGSVVQFGLADEIRRTWLPSD
ncbi:ATP-binding cassette domain-containing protein [Herbaspirillum sp. RTI4]|uniref:ABC transporter ATP-binding protein n=1 Tax=Herbaspirillum sp. RTI4 TaxID=3048640 RepID=UPI002AB53F19|nr:ATP-binding cassette domain-containing protein [Herbaspirillum sp. RTI4]MDY7577110.1 ATP-binding cassette domain-containing protein [Herbaspirillum sp. RTI4]MEA9982852.1 ATP-binding cassette domain-containing protein [Herbaspirillum sp. RTI4]